MVRDGSKVIGKADYSGQVRDGWREKGKIVNDRYVDEYGRDLGWVSRSSSGGSDSSGLILFFVFGVFYLMYLGIKWVIDQIGKKSA